MSNTTTATSFRILSTLLFAVIRLFNAPGAKPELLTAPLDILQYKSQDDECIGKHVAGSRRGLIYGTILTWHFRGWNEENYENPQSG
jgi:hypothetical protein